MPQRPFNMEDWLELLEEKFRRVELASERRVLESELSQTELVDPLTEPRKHRKKPAVSVSQFGKQEAREDGGLRSPVPSPLSVAAFKSTFYHALANPRSVESLVSGEGMYHTDEQQEIRVERIGGRQKLPQSVGALLPRRLTRTKSHVDYRSINQDMVIDVSVETTTESPHHPPNVSTAYATRPSRPRAATVGAVTSQVGLVGRAKGFASKLRRKSRVDLP